jgi:ankyrin repeat protein
MRTILIAFLMTLATQVAASCGNLCDGDWWAKAFAADVEAEIALGADVAGRSEYKDATPLHFAAYYSTLPAVHALLKAGADVMAQDNKGDTPLHWAAKGGSVDIVEAFLATGADVTAHDNQGHTPLHRAAYSMWPNQEAIRA